jgi:hypothetical protein
MMRSAGLTPIVPEGGFFTMVRRCGIRLDIAAFAAKQF